jgi:SAM-dependent methyltransferase
MKAILICVRSLVVQCVAWSVACRDSCELSSELEDARYLRERRDPRPGDPMYLHLSDLALALRAAVDALGQPADVLDFGCGGSPYRDLFEGARYRRADFAGDGAHAHGLDYVIFADGAIDAGPESFDLVVSTQVLEHVPDFASYLRQCLRVLKPGGQLLLSTHGTFEDHGCPHDFRRWTAEGLERDVAQAGFEVVCTQKLTTDARALGFLLRTRSFMLPSGRGFGVLFTFLHRVLTSRARQFDVWCDKRFAGSRVVDVAERGHAMYIALLCRARKPAASPG